MMRVAAGLILGAVLVGCGGGLEETPVRGLPSATLGSPGAGGEFGRAVAFVGDRVAVGAPDEGNSSSAGRVHIYDRDTGDLLRTLESPAARAGGRFGASVASTGRDIVVGAPGEGRAYLVDPESGEVRATYEPLPGPGGGFGAAVAAIGAEVWIGAPGRAAGAGEIYRFAEPGGALLGVLESAGSTVGGSFGASLAAVGERVLAGAPGEGRAYLIDRSGAQLVLTRDSDSFGLVVAGAGQDLVVGAPREGRAFLFDGTTGELRRELANPGSGRFGVAVAVVDGHVLVAGTGDGPRVHLFDSLTGAFERTAAVPGGEAVDPGGMSLDGDNGVALIGVFLLPGAARGLASSMDCTTSDILAEYESPAAATGNRFGQATLIVSGFICVGEPASNGGDGAVHVYDGSGAFQRTILAPNPGGSNRFGHFLAPCGTKMIVGAPFEDVGMQADVGQAYVVDPADGSVDLTLVDPTPEAGAQFGFSGVKVNGEIAIGVPFGGATSAGTVHVFDEATGAFARELPNPNGVGNGNRFGWATTGFQGNLVVGAPGQDSVSLLNFATGAEILPFGPGDTAPEEFGFSLAATGNCIWIGAPEFDVDLGQETRFNAGHVLVFDGVSGMLEKDIISLDVTSEGRFGSSLTASGNRVAVGGINEIPGGDPPLQSEFGGSGLVHVYDADALLRLRRFASLRPILGGVFGFSVDLDGDRLAVGAPLESGGAAQSGRAYLFDIDVVVNVFSPNPEEFGGFGESLAPCGQGHVVIGAFNENGGVGRAYRLDLATGMIDLTIEAPQGIGSVPEFGTQVVVIGTDIFVSAPLADNGGQVFRFDQTGALQNTFVSPNGGGFFGGSMAEVDGNILIGASLEGNGDGAAYLFAPDGTPLQSYFPPVAGQGGIFGISVGAIGTDCAIGAMLEPLGGTRLGNIHIFSSTTGQLERTIPNPDPADDGNSLYGSAVGQFQGDLLAGAPGTPAGGTVYLIRRSDGGVMRTFTHPAAPLPGAGFGEFAQGIDGLIGIGVELGEFLQGEAFLFDDQGNVVQQFFSPNGKPFGGFGVPIVLADGFLAMGAPDEDVNPTGAGRAYLFPLPQTQPLPDADFILESPTPATGGDFGFAVGIAGFDPVIAAPGENGGRGNVHVFDGEDGSFADTVSSLNPVPNGRFGHALSLNAALAAVGAPGENGGAPGAGRAYLFSSLDGSPLLSFLSNNPQTGGGFGFCVALAAANVVVGAPGEDGGAPGAGRAYYFDCAIEDVLQTFESPNAIAGGQFGAGCAAIAFEVFVGAPGENGGQPRSGRAYRFDGLSGALLASYVSPNPEDDGNFGAAMALFGNNILIAAPGETVGTTANAGRVYLLNADTGAEIRRFESPNPQSGGLFGAAIVATAAAGVPEIRIGIGAPGESGSAGRAYLFDGVDGSLFESFTSPNEGEGGAFGFSLAILVTGDNGIIGAPGESTGQVQGQEGRAYVGPDPDQEG